MSENEIVKLGHGGGGRMARRLVEEIVREFFDVDNTHAMDDSAVMETGAGRIAFTTDSYVINPLFFPGGDIGRLAVCGTVNDLSVMGAEPVSLSCALIMEEGFLLSDLERILSSMRDTSKEAGVTVVTGDTKVVEKGAVKGIFINTAGVGRIPDTVKMGMCEIKAGDSVIVTGTIGDHGTAVIAARNELELETTLESDCRPVNMITKKILETAPGTRFMRDPTRGGLGGTLNDIAIETRLGILLNEELIPVKPEVRSICDLLGFDPFYMANEGKVVAVIPSGDADSVIEALKRVQGGERAAIIGVVSDENPGRVVMATSIGGKRIIAYPEQDQLPRIC